MADAFKARTTDGRNGDAGGTVKGTLLRWIAANVDHSTDECLRWPFATGANGYGVASCRKAGVSVARHVHHGSRGAANPPT
jgi:hypothetical protein